MSTPGSPLAEGSIRRIRSDGDIPRQPERAYTPSHIRVESQNLSPLHQVNLVSGGLPSSSSGPSSVPAVGVTAFHTNAPIPGPHSPPAQRPDQHPALTQHPSLYVRILTYFGLGRRASHARKAFVSMIWNMAWGVFQFTVIVVMLILTGTHFKSTTNPSISEWTACDRPLGVWASLWIVRAVLSTSLGYWEFRRDRLLHPARADSENGQPPQGNEPTHIDLVHPPTPTPIPYGPHQHVEHGTGNNGQPPEQPSLPHSALFSRLTLLSSLMTLSWFLTAHILEYTSINTCRFSSPHLWWLVFGILCIMYLMVLEVVLLGFVVLVVAPVLFIFWNIFLICIGRHPIQNPGMIKPEIGKLSKSVVERIPLVVYIPPPPPTDTTKETGDWSPHLYPPKTPALERKPTQTRFKLLRNFSSFVKKPTSGKAAGEADVPEIDSWRENWEQGEYPFITLEGNRAACAICLMDFEEPKRKNAAEEEKVEDQTIKEQDENIETSAPTDVVEEGRPSNARDPSPRVPAVIEEQRQADLKLSDAGDGSQPLRLLACGHVFHKTCLDPWLTDVSGRCPVCQRPVEVTKAAKGRQPPS